METTTFDRERELAAQDLPFVIGIDEAGRGPLCGPVVAAAVCFRDPLFVIPEQLIQEFSLVRDSKKLSEKQREKVFDLIQEHFHVGIGLARSDVIDRVNILQATFLAMRGALTMLRKKLPQEALTQGILLIDGNQLIPNISCRQEAVIGGDSTVKSIAAASIIAKVTRDRMMLEYDRQYPQYGLARHKGYGTKEHMDALRKYGPSPIHRLSFKPVLLSIPENANRRFSNVLKPRK